MKYFTASLAMATSIAASAAPAEIIEGSPPVVNKSAQTITWGSSNIGTRSVTTTYQSLNCKFGTLAVGGANYDGGAGVVDLAASNTTASNLKRSESARKECIKYGLEVGF